MTSNQEFAAERTQLISKRDELRARIDKIEADYRNGLDADSEEQAQQLANAEVLEGIAKAASEELQRIEKLLEEMG
jgi:RNA polymerase-binding transcription factor DksA